MNQHAPSSPAHVTPDLSLDAGVPSEASTRLHGRWLRIVRLVWLLLVVFNLTLFVASLPSAYERTLHGEFLSDPLVRRNLQDAGLSVGTYALLQTVPILFGALVATAVGLLIFWGRPADPMALFVALVLITMFAGPDADWIRNLPPALGVPAAGLRSLAFASLGLFFFLFPDGRFVPRWTGWVALLWIASQVIDLLSVAPFLSILFLPMLFGMVSAFVFAQIYRYRYVSGPIQRQQTKWVVFSVGAALIPGLLGGLVLVLVPSLAPNGSLAYVVGQALVVLPLNFIPVSIGIAILRYRLWDIDILIRRTLIYGTLTTALGVVYFASVVLLQQLLRVLTGQGRSQLAVVASTLAIAALFQPFRRRIQAVIDRRFYRRKYDAAQTLQALSAKIRNEVDLDTLTGDLVAVVEETLQPSHVSLWLRDLPAPRQPEG